MSDISHNFFWRIYQFSAHIDAAKHPKIDALEKKYDKRIRRLS